MIIIYLKNLTTSAASAALAGLTLSASVLAAFASL